MNQPACQSARDQEARQRAAAILAQSHPAEPAMKRYAHPIPCWSAPVWSPPPLGERAWTGCWRSWPDRISC